MEKINIAIDGPSGSGKSTLAKNVAKNLGIIYLDTGAMFRCLGLKSLRENIEVSNVKAIEEMLIKTDVDVKYINGDMHIYLDGIEVSNEIRENVVSKCASDISAIPAVREKLIVLQRQIAQENDVVLDGRDIGTVVLPNAKFKYFLVADTDERARRRHDELKAKGEIVEVELLKMQIEQRDYNDSTRATAPLRKADDAKVIDTTFISINEVVKIVLDDIEEKN